MNARYWQRGETLDYTATEAVTNGQVVSLGNRIGVAGNDIAESATGALHVTGVYVMDKKASEKSPWAPLIRQRRRNHHRGQCPAGYAPLTRRPATPPCW
ncbi:MAG: capsid cement protein [Flavonifractor plautii]